MLKRADRRPLKMSKVRDVRKQLPQADTSILEHSVRDVANKTCGTSTVLAKSSTYRVPKVAKVPCPSVGVTDRPQCPIIESLV